MNADREKVFRYIHEHRSEIIAAALQSCPADDDTMIRIQNSVARHIGRELFTEETRAIALSLYFLGDLLMAEITNITEAVQ